MSREIIAREKNSSYHCLFHFVLESVVAVVAVVDLLLLYGCCRWC